MNCEICKDDGKCLNNESHKDYEKNNKDFFGTNYWDCVDYSERKTNTVGQTMKNYVKNLQKEEPYESDFCKWNSTITDS